jgi:uncharacterized protein (AIM24 family)
MAFTTAGSRTTHASRPGKGYTHDVDFTIRGSIAPLVAFELHPAQSLLCDFDDVRLLDNDITIRPWPSLSRETRLLINTHATCKQQVVLSKSRSGLVGTFKLSRYAGHLLCRSRTFLAAGPAVTASSYTRHETGVYGELEFLTMEGRGWVFLQADGEVFERTLNPDETLRVNAGALVAMSATVKLAAVPEHGRRQQDKDVDGRLAQVTGSGSIWLQSCLYTADTANHKNAKNRKPQLTVVS